MSSGCYSPNGRGGGSRSCELDPACAERGVDASGEWRLVVAKSQFEPLREARLPNPQTIDREGGGGVLRVDGLDRRLAQYGQAAATRRSEVIPHC
jgi:hypothetical protein